MKDNPVILIVDDQIQNIELLEAYLLPTGYEIITAENGKDALEKLSYNQVDLILLDVMMPEMNGFEVTKKIRKDNSNQLIPIVLITALKETEERIKGIEAGCDDFLSKPVDKMELLARVRSLLKIKEYHDLIIKQKEQLFDLNREKNKLISVMAHDLINAFTGIIGLSEVLQIQLEHINIQEKAKKIDMLKTTELIHNSGRRGYMILEGLLNWFLLNKESAKGETEVFKINELALEIGALFKSNLLEKEITFEIKMGDEQVFGDKEMIKTVLRNLVANAIKFTPKKGRIVITAVPEKGVSIVTVEDTGIGMSPNAIKKLFKLNSNKSTKGTENEPGTGLGLILCKDIIEKNKGSILVESIEGKGSKFSFMLPSSK